MGKPRKLVYGIGINYHEGVIWVNGRHIPSYQAWHAMLERCYSAKCHTKYPTYIGCSVCAEWLYFSEFKKWHDKNCVQGWCLDKDLLVLGNKIYSPETCTYVPSALNNLFTDHGAKRGEYPQGVNWHKRVGKFEAKLSLSGKRKHLGYFSNPEAASDAYQQAKRLYVLSECDRYRNLYPDNKPLMQIIKAIEVRT